MICLFALIAFANCSNLITIQLESELETEALDDFFWKVSDPESNQYRKYPTFSEIVELVQASDKVLLTMIKVTLNDL